MSWFFASNNGLEEQVEKATSSSLEDLALNLEISDIIRSKTVQPKEAMRSLKRRVEHKNPNIQLAALRLTDTCVKNGGPHFLIEIASREFMDNLVSLINAPGACTPEVKAKMLEVIQTWATAFEGMSQLSYVQDVYNRLRNEGHDFPPRARITSSFVDSSAPPEWTNSAVCMRCRTAFTIMNRTHHCRNCGSAFCGSCSSKNLPLPDLGIVQPVRVCDGCHIKLTEKKASVKANIHRSLHGDAHKHHSSWNKPPVPSMQPRNARVEDDDDEDLKMALKMSLDEVRGAGRTRYVSQSQLQTQQAQQNSSTSSSTAATTAAATTTTTQTTAKPPRAKTQEEEEDEELKAAIAASLKDMEEQKAKSAWSNPTTASAAAARASTTAARPDHELSPVEAENISLFATLVDRLQSQPPGTILREPQIQELYESIGTLRPKLARTFGDTMSKYEALCDLHAKLATVVRYYDKMLEERFQQTYSRHNISGLPPQAQHRSSTYPSLPPSGDGGYYPRNPEARVPPPSSTIAYQNYYTQPQSYNKMVGGIPPSQPQQQQPSQPLQQKAQESPSQHPYYNGYPTPQPAHQTPTPQQQPSQPPPSVPHDGPPSPQQPHSQPPPAAAGQAQPQQPSQPPSAVPPVEQSYWQYPPPQPKGQDGPGGYPYPYPPQQYPPQQPPQWQQQQQPGGQTPQGGYAYPGGGGGGPLVSQEAPPPPQQQQVPVAKSAEPEPSLIDL